MNLTKSRTAKFVAGLAGFAMMFSFAFIAHADTASDLQAQINSLLATIQSLQAQLAATTGGSTVSTGYTFNTNLTVGSKGTDVMHLQKVLNMSADTQIAATGAGSPGNETSTFGQLTKAAVIKFQIKYGITPAAGYVGAITRAKLNSMGGTTGTTGTTGGTTVAGAVSVVAGVQPVNTIAPALAARVPFTNFTVTAGAAPVTINSVTVMRQGPALDTDFAGVVLVDASTGVQLGTSRVFDANHSATIGTPITIPAGTSKTFTVAGNIAAAGSIGPGDVAAIAVTAINTASTVSGSLPISGAQQTINSSLTIGTATISTSSFDPNAASTQPIGTTAYRFTGVRVQAGSTEDLTMKSITWYQSGSASGIQNVVTIVNGTSYPAVADSTGRYYTTVFPSGIVIPKGQQADVYVQGDLGANTTANTYAEFDIYRNTDIYLTGNQYGYGITPTISGTASYNTTSSHQTIFVGGSSTPWIQGSTVTVTAGQFSTIQNASSVGAQNIAINVPNQPLGGFQTNLTGEGIQVQSLVVHFTTGATLLPLQNVSLVDENGAIVGGPYNAVNTSDATGATVSAAGTTIYQKVTFTGAINFNTGTHTYTLKGQLQTGATNGTTIQASTNPTSDWTNITGSTTGNTITTGVANFTMNTMTVQAASLAVNNGTSPVSQTVVAGGQNIPFATVQLDASQSGEDVRLSSVPMVLTTTGGQVANLSNCQLYNGSTALNTGSYVINGLNLASTSPVSVNFSFNNSLTVPKGSVLNLSLTCTLSSAADSGQSYSWAPNTSGTYATGATSGSTIAVGSIGGSAPTMLVASAASLALGQDSSAPAYTIVAGGSTGITMNVLQFRATNEAVNLQKLALKLTGNPSDIVNAYIYTGSGVLTPAGVAIAPNTLIGTVSFSGGATATSTLTQVVQLPINTYSTLVIKADLSAIGVNQAGTEGDLVKIDSANAYGVGANSGKTVNKSVITSSSGVGTYATYPTVAAGPAATANPNGASQTLKKFSISANARGAIGLDTLKINIATSSGVTLTNVKLFAYTDPGYSQPVNVPGTTGGLFGVAIDAVVSGATQTFSQSVNVHAPVEIGAGSTMYFTLVGDVAISGTTNNWTVSATLQGDTSPQTGMAAIAGVTGGNFVWSPNATTTAVSTDNDWTNGYSIPGLPSTGL